MDEMLHHTKAVVRGTKRALIVADMPFLSYPNADAALANAGRFLREAGVQAVKLEGGVRSAKTIEALVRAGIPVMGHIGLTPQAINTLGKVRVQGKNREQARRCSPTPSRSRRPGRSRSCSSSSRSSSPRRSPSGCGSRRSGSGRAPGAPGQIQVINDTLGYGDWTPKHARQYADLRGTILGAVSQYRADVEAGTFPGEAETVRMDEAVLDEVLGRAADDRAAAPSPLAGIPLDRDL